MDKAMTIGIFLLATLVLGMGVHSMSELNDGRVRVVVAQIVAGN